MAYVGAGGFLQDMNDGLHAGMVSRMMASNSGGAADALAGGLMARGAAVGRPLVSGAMGMLGLDPMSIGMRAASSAWGSGAGVLGAGLAGAGAAAGIGVIGLGASFVGNQMYSGAQQQLALNQGLRQNFNFSNSQGGLGFTSNQGYQIGSALRGMTHEFGPSGEVATFGELSRLATNMGRMGLGQNVRSVGEFKEKFKEMVDTLKKVAHDMGSSLEEAQKFVQSMRGSGIFRTADQLKMSQGTRLTAAAGGLAMSEVTGMANIGSQISRSVGGLGRQGAFAGMKTIEQVGLAQRVGAINDEDVYNATGLTGAEGRQALATSQLQQSASFLSSGRGRRFLASISGKNGQLNEDAVQEYLMGGNVSTSRTMELAHQNLEGVGRANFIRNEGRLRGAALEKFGGLAQSLVYKQWLSSRGYDPTSMDDKSMLAFQRFSGMGRDEADLAIKQIQKLPEMMQEMRHAKSELAYSDEVNKYSKTVGVEGLRRKFEQSREKIQGHFQQAGADIMQEGSELLARWFNRVMGVYERRQVEGVADVMRMAKSGHADAGRQMDRLVAGSKIMPGAEKLGKIGDLGALGGGGLSAVMRMSNAASAVAGVEATAQDTALVGGKSMSGFREAFTDRAAGLGGLQRADAIRDIIKEKGGSGSEAWLKEYGTADETKKLQMAARLEKASGFGEGSGIGNTLTAQNIGVNDSGVSGWRKYLGIGAKAGATEGEVNQLIGAGMVRSEKKSTLGDSLKQGLKVGAMSALLGPLGAVAGAYSNITDMLGQQAKEEAAGAFMKTKEGRSTVAGILEGGGADYDSAMNKLADLQTKRAKGGELDRQEQAQLDTIQNARVSRELGLQLQKSNKTIDQLTAADKKEITDKARKIFGRDVSFEEVLKGVGSIKAGLDLNAQAALQEVKERTMTDIKGMREEMKASGMAEMGPDGKLKIRTDKLDKLDPNAKAAYQLASEIATTEFTGDVAKDSASVSKLYGSSTETGTYAQLQQRIAGMSLEEKRKAARSLGGSDPVGQMMATSAAREERLQGQIKRTKGGAGQTETAIASLMGVDVTKEMRADLAKGSLDDAAAILMQQQGITARDKGADSYKKQLVEVLKSGREGKMGVAADALSSLESNADDNIKQKLEKARESKMGPAEQSAKHLGKMVENSDKMKTLMEQQLAALKELKKDNPDSNGNNKPTTTKPGG